LEGAKIWLWEEEGEGEEGREEGGGREEGEREERWLMWAFWGRLGKG
jgi:hypothetical protein